MVIYQYSNGEPIGFLFLNGFFILLGIILSVIGLPFLKLLFTKGNPVKPRLALLFLVAVPIYVISITFIVGGAANFCGTAISLQSTDTSTCKISEGVITELEKTPQTYRGEIWYYDVAFTVDGNYYHIYDDYHLNLDGGVPAELIGEWENGEEVTVYYRIKNRENVVIKVEKSLKTQKRPKEDLMLSRTTDNN